MITILISKIFENFTKYTVVNENKIVYYLYLIICTIWTRQKIINKEILSSLLDLIA